MYILIGKACVLLWLSSVFIFFKDKIEHCHFGLFWPQVWSSYFKKQSMKYPSKGEGNPPNIRCNIYIRQGARVKGGKIGLRHVENMLARR